MSRNIVYTSIPEIIQSCKSMQDMLNMMDMILVNMLFAINTATETGQFEGYKLDTGQTKNEVTYRSLAELQLAFDRMFQSRRNVQALLNNNNQGRVLRLVDGKNFIGGYNGR